MNTDTVSTLANDINVHLYTMSGAPKRAHRTHPKRIEYINARCNLSEAIMTGGPLVARVMDQYCVPPQIVSAYDLLTAREQMGVAAMMGLAPNFTP